MNALIAGLFVMMTIIGIFVAIFAMIKRPVVAKPPRRSLVGRKFRLSNKRKIIIIVSCIAGIVVAVLTQMTLAVILVPAAALGLPWLMSAPGTSASVDKLNALEEWTRALAAMMSAGAGLEQAIEASLRSVPAQIRPEVSQLVARLHRFPTVQALQAFADDLNDETGDKIAASLALAARRGGTGLASSLEGLASSVALDVATRRRVLAEQEKPRITARWVTLITVGFVTLFIFGTPITGQYTQPYRSPLGQLILIILIGVYVGLLLWLRQIAKPEKLPRFFGAAARGDK